MAPLCQVAAKGWGKKPLAVSGRLSHCCEAHACIARLECPVIFMPMAMTRVAEGAPGGGAAWENCRSVALGCGCIMLVKIDRVSGSDVDMALGAW